MQPGKGQSPAGFFQSWGARALVGAGPVMEDTLPESITLGSLCRTGNFSLPGAVLVSGLFLPAQGARLHHSLRLLV